MSAWAERKSFVGAARIERAAAVRTVLAEAAHTVIAVSGWVDRGCKPSLYWH